MPFFSRWPLRKQLLLLFVISIIPVLGIILYSGVEQTRHKTEEIQKSSFSVMQAISNRQQVITESSRQLLATLSGMPEVQRMDARACDALFRRLLPENPVYSNMFLLTNDGTLLSSAVPSKQKDFSDRKYFKDVLSTRGFSIGEYLVARITGLPVLTLSYPVLDSQGEVKGVLAVALDLRRYDHIVADAKLPDNTAIALADHKGIRLYRYPNPDKYIGKPVTPAIMEHAKGVSDEGTILETGSDGIKRFYAYKKFRLTKDSPPYLYFFLGIPEQQMLRDVWSDTRRNLIILGLVFAFVLSFFWFMEGYIISDPINKLVAVTNRFKDGELGIKTGLPHTENELGQLAEAFDKMSSELKTRHDEQKQTMDVLRESEDRYRTVVSSSTDGIILQESTGKILTWNSAAERIFGISTEEALRHTSTSRAWKTYGENGSEILGTEHPSMQTFATGEPCRDIVMKVVRDTGDFSWININTSPIFEKGNTNPRAVVITFSDITERRLAEEALKESEYLYRNFFDNANDGIMLMTLEGRIVNVNQSYAVMHGYSIEEIIKMDITQLDVMKNGALSDRRDQMQRLLAGERLVFDVEHFHKDGRILTFSISTNVIEIQGKKYILGFHREITHQKILEERYKQLFDNILDGFALHEIIYDDKGEPINYRFIAVNPAFEHITGLKAEEIIGRTVLDVLPDIERRWIETYGKVVTTGKPVSFENYAAELKKFFMVTAFRPAPNKFACVFSDITNSKQSEKALRESEEKYRSLFETSTQGILIYDRAGTIQIANPSMMDLLGAKHQEEVVGRPYLDFLHPDDREESTARVNKIFRDAFEAPVKIDLGQASVPIREHRIIKTNGDVVNVESTGVAFQYRGSTHIQGIFHDITKRKQAQDELIEQFKFLQVLIDTIPIPVFFKDTNGIYLGSNRACEIFFGPRDQLIGKTVYDVSPKDIADVYSQADLELFNNPGIQIYETIAADKTGARRNVIFNKATYQDKNGNMAGLIGAIFDITERKQTEAERRELEERLQRAEKMESLGLLAGGVAHDLNNVLGIVVGYAEMLMDELDEANPMRDDLEKILEGGNRSAAIVQDLLTLARRGVQTKKTVNLNATIMDCQKLPEFEKVFSYNLHVKIKTDLEADLLNIMGSPVHLDKTIINLASNAVEAMPNGGVLKIATTNQYLDAPIQGYDNIREGDYVVLSVSDTGEGISERDIKRIFEPFYTKKIMGRSGTGLGLAVVWGTIKDHNGYINVESEEGKGTTFTLYFPVTREEISSEQISVSMFEYMGSGETILIVDDINRQRELASRMLTKLSYSVSTVASGEEAVEYLKKNKADLIVLDMIMDPGIDGLETYEKILEISPAQKAVIVSGFSESDRVKEAQRIGAGAYVPKPYVLERLGIAVRKELDRK